MNKEMGRIGVSKPVYYGRKEGKGEKKGKHTHGKGKIEHKKEGGPASRVPLTQSRLGGWEKTGILPELL